MKKVFKILLIVVICVTCVAVFSACSGKNKQSAAKVSLVLNGGSGVDVKDFVSDKFFVEPVNPPVRDGYAFDGWFLDEELSIRAIFNTELTENITVYAAWRAKRDTAAFVLGAEGEKIVYAQDGKFAPPAVARKGYDLVGWYTDPRLTVAADFDLPAVDGAVFYAKWEIINYTISYELDGLGENGVTTKYSYTVWDSVDLPAPRNVKPGYTFLGWEDENGDLLTNLEKESVGNKVLKAKFICSNNSVERVIGGNVEGDIVRLAVPNNAPDINFNERITVSDRAKMTVKIGNSEIIGTWRAPSEETALNLIVTAENGDVREYSLIVTKYEDVNLTVNVHILIPGQESNTAVPMKKGGVLSIAIAEIRGYAFKGMYLDEEFTEEFSADSAILENIDVYLRYEIIVYTVEYDAGEGQGDERNVKEYTINDAFDLYDAIPPEGYTFVGWYDENDRVVERVDMGTVGNLRLHAVYEPKPDGE